MNDSDKSCGVWVEPFVAVLTGVSASGKSSVGRAVAELLAIRFIEGDDYQPPENRARMAAGLPLSAEERKRYVAQVADACWKELDAMRSLVVACSALYRSLRNMLRVSARAQVFLLDCSRSEVERRLKSREHPFFAYDPALVADQFKSLEWPSPDEGVVVLDGHRPVPQLVAEVVGELRARLVGSVARAECGI